MPHQTIAALMADHRKNHGRRLSDKSIVALIFEGNYHLEHTEETLDTWWANLTPEQKAVIYEADLGPADDTAPAFPWSILAEANRVSARINTLVNAPLTAPDLLETGGHFASV